MAKSQPTTDAASASLSALAQSPAGARDELAKVESLGSELPLIQHMTQVMPVPDFFFGGGMLLLIVLIHAAGMRMLTDRFEMSMQRLGPRGSTWRPDLLMGGVVLLMLLLHLVEIWVWSAALVYSGLVDNWRAAGFFAANTYTTVGYGNFVLPDGWHMLAPIHRHVGPVHLRLDRQRAGGDRAPLPGSQVPGAALASAREEGLGAAGLKGRRLTPICGPSQESSPAANRSLRSLAMMIADAKAGVPSRLRQRAGVTRALRPRSRANDLCSRP